ncbi:MAG TPA: FecR domain-containing protein [Dyella sp.]|uniref:FecR family protein n=1 Tax=Dyella sp. TaxID=1869338 RepID=UPI002D106D52|nr:FecR domain-containing protein [Dyella sp.]HTV84688.1 FecR domain-containing protein [Dyella sp.]
MAKTNPRKQEQILHAAADWWVKLREPDATGETIEQWLAWTAEDERHLAMFERMNDLAGRLGSLDAVSRRGLINAFAPPSKPWRRWLPLAAAASMAVAALSGTYLLWRAGVSGAASQVYTSAIAQNKDIVLPDGTQVALGAASTLAMHFSHGQRRVELRQGEAFFQVVHDNSRPFEVAAGEVSVRDIGTAFDVRRTGDRVTVAVTQGRVQIAQISAASGHAQQGTLEVSAGQLVSYDPHSGGMTIGSIVPEQATGWRDDRLDFIDEPLSVVVANLNRYSARQLRIADADLGTLSYTGSIRTDAIDGWLSALPRVFPLRVSTVGNQVILSDAAHPAPR